MVVVFRHGQPVTFQGEHRAFDDERAAREAVANVLLHQHAVLEAEGIPEPMRGALDEGWEYRELELAELVEAHA